MAFEQANCVFRVDADLVIKKQQDKKGRWHVDLLAIRGSCKSFDPATARHPQAFKMVQRTMSRQGMPSQPISIRQESEFACVP